MGRMGPGHTSMAICSWMLMVAFSPRRRRVMQAARSRPGAARPGLAQPRPGAARRAGGARRGCGQRRRRPRDGPDAAATCSAAAGASECRGPAGGGRAQPRHPAAAKQRVCGRRGRRGAGAGAGAERAERRTHRRSHRAHAGPGPRARTHAGGQGHLGAFHSRAIAGLAGS